MVDFHDVENVPVMGVDRPPVVPFPLLLIYAGLQPPAQPERKVPTKKRTWNISHVRRCGLLCSGRLARQHCKQTIQPSHKTRRIIELAAFGEQGLLEQQVSPVAKAVVVGLAIQTRDQGMLRVDL